MKASLKPPYMIALMRKLEIWVILLSTFLMETAPTAANSLMRQGYLDEQFIQLEELQDAENPNFVEEVVTMYYRDSARLIQNIEQALEKNPLDFAKLDNNMHQFMGSSSSIGAKKLKNECTQFNECCKTGNGEGCKRTFQQVKKEYAALKKKLEQYFQFSRQIGPVEKACRPK
ncbi:unnamed protein product [Fraxinus pennsylvanica]|uniref:Histidine-containing phosphotransfer protein n=1 Tax=Fraxinus pennsylvanica TaxID=56036 RepID=A0AAD2DMJ6_9LAMI|nr:unnamed protein product [Fraxinus pennsylvanica]